MNHASEEFTKEICNSMLKLKKISKDIEEIIGIFLLILDVKEQTWNRFKVVIYSIIKHCNS